jgi:Tfp pilus assembly major pilin PilA
MQHLKIKRERRKTVEKETCKVTAASEENDRKINTD